MKNNSTDLLYQLIHPNSPDISSDNTIQSRQKYSLTNEKCENKQKTLRFCSTFGEVSEYTEIRKDTLRNNKDNLKETIITNFLREFSKMSPEQKTGILNLINNCISGNYLHEEYKGEIYSIYSKTIEKISRHHGKDLIEPFFQIYDKNFSIGTLTQKGKTMAYKFTDKLQRTIENYTINENYIKQVKLTDEIKINVPQAIEDAKLLIELHISGDIDKYNQIFKPKKEITSLDELKIRKQKLISVLENVIIDKYVTASNGREMLHSEFSNIQMLNTEIRNRLFSGLGYFDIDMVNSHYSLLLNWLEKEKFTDRELINSIDPTYTGNEFKYLKHYINNRAEVINELSIKYDITKVKVKEMLLALLNGGLNNWKNTVFEDMGFETIKDILQDNFISSLKLEINEIKDIVYYFFGAGEIERGKVMSNLLTKLESEVLNIICTTYQDNIILKMFDGWVSNKEMDISEIEKLIEDKTGFRIEFKQTKL